MKVWITKYALTKGIFEIEARIVEDFKGMAVYKLEGSCMHEYAHAGEWYKSYEEALEKAEDMRNKKIISLQKQIIKLNDINFKKK
jgi:hypothetical protein